MRFFLLISYLMIFLNNFNAQSIINFTVDLNQPVFPISPYIYGTNDILSGTENWTAFRLGGNRLTGYNWENNASNAGADWNHSSDDYMLGAMNVPTSRRKEPGAVSSVFHQRSVDNNAYSLITIQLAGYVAKDMNGSVPESQKAPSSRWAEVLPSKGSSFSLTPDLNDNYVYMDEYINYNVNKFGNAASGGINGYSLDNEPALWPSTHPRIHPAQTQCTEITAKGISFSKAVKNIDSTAEIFGPALYGFAAYTDFQGASDWNTVKVGKSYSWFIDYYLDEMKKAELKEGRRLLDVLDLHWYPEAMGDHRIVNSDANSEKDKLARVQAPRTLWDAKYVENSWIGQWGKAYLPLIPKVKASIKKYYPGTKLAFTEITYGGPNDISGGIATSDMLGILAKYEVYFVCQWPLANSAPYYSAAYKMYTNYDGSNSSFGSLYTYSKTSDSVNTSVYGSITEGKNEIHIIAINKNLTDSYTGNFTVISNKNIVSGNTWYIDNNSSTIKQGNIITTIQNNTFSYILPAGSVTHIVLLTDNVLAVKDKIIPDDFSLSAYPNPFNPVTNFSYSIPLNNTASIEIYDVNGALIKYYSQLNGVGKLTWNGTNNSNQSVSSGVYFVILKGENQKFITQKVMLLK